MISKFSNLVARKINPKMIRRFYDNKVVEYFENPPNVGSLPKDNPNVGTSTVGSVACGDLLKMQV